MNCGKSGFDFFVSVPCKLLANLITMLEADRSSHLHAGRSRGRRCRVGMRGLFGGPHPAIVMQNSGFGNSTNAILSLLNYYRVPVVFVVSHRGTAGEPIEAQCMMGAAVADF